MQTLTFLSAGTVEWRDAPVPRLASSLEALVRPLAVSRCDLDMVLVAGKAPAAGPFPLGHECVGEVIEVGDGVRTVAPGDRVIVPFQISCGGCSRCKRGQTGSCESVPKLSAYGLGPFGGGGAFGGALSDVLRVPFADAMLVPLPTGADPVLYAALGDNALDGFRTVREPLAREPNAPVLIAGGGAPSVGLFAVLAARALGASEVVYVDPSEARASLAAALGARVVQAKCEPSLRVGRFPITVDATSRPEGLRFVLGSTDVGGTCTSVGIYFGDVPMDLFALYTRGIRFLTGRVDARHELPRALAVLGAHAGDLTKLATKIVPFDDAHLAWVEPAAKLVIHRS